MPRASTTTSMNVATSSPSRRQSASTSPVAAAWTVPRPFCNALIVDAAPSPPTYRWPRLIVSRTGATSARSDSFPRDGEEHLRLARLLRRPEDRRIEMAGAVRLEGGADGPRHGRIDGGAVAGEETGPGGGGDAVTGEVERTHRIGRRQAREDDGGPSRGHRGGGNDLDCGYRLGGTTCGAGNVDREHPVTRVRRVGRHRQAHVAQPDEGDVSATGDGNGRGSGAGPSRRIAPMRGPKASRSIRPPERDSSGLAVVDEALELVHPGAAAARHPPSGCEPVADMDNADALDCQGTPRLRTKLGSERRASRNCGHPAREDRGAPGSFRGLEAGAPGRFRFGEGRGTGRRNMRNLVRLAPALSANRRCEGAVQGAERPPAGRLPRPT